MSNRALLVALFGDHITVSRTKSNDGWYTIKVKDQTITMGRTKCEAMNNAVGVVHAVVWKWFRETHDRS